MYYIDPHEKPTPFVYSRRQIADGIGLLVAVAAALAGISVLLLGAFGW